MLSPHSPIPIFSRSPPPLFPQVKELHQHLIQVLDQRWSHLEVSLGKGYLEVYTQGL